MQVIELNEVLAPVKVEALKLIKEAIREAKNDNRNVYINKTKACQILDIDIKTFNNHLLNKLPIYYLGDSKIRRFKKQDILNLVNKMEA